MEILRSIEKNIIDITNANNDIDADMLKKNIKSYFEKMADKENINNMKRDKYYEEYENKRVEQHINYDNYLREKAELMETFKNDKTKTALHNYLKLKPPKYDNITLYSYLDVKIAEDKPFAKQLDKPVIKKLDKPVIKKLDKCTPAKKAECEKKGKFCNPDTGRCVNADKPAAKEDKPVAKEDKCTEAKKAECEKKGKICNQDTGRCVKADKPAAKADKPAAKADKPVAKEDKPAAKEDKPDAKEDKPAAKEDKPAAKEDKPAAKEDKCTEAKKAECEKKGKKCNPDTGRCIKK